YNGLHEARRWGLARHKSLVKGGKGRTDIAVGWEKLSAKSHPFKHDFCSYFSLDVKFETSFLGFRLLLASLVLALHGLGNPINRPRVTKPGLLDTQKISNGFARIQQHPVNPSLTQID